MSGHVDSSGAGATTPPPGLALAVDDPTAVAAGCWDAGLTVIVEELADGSERLVVEGPGGIRVALVASTSPGV